MLETRQRAGLRRRERSGGGGGVGRHGGGSAVCGGEKRWEGVRYMQRGDGNREGRV